MPADHDRVEASAPRPQDAPQPSSATSGKPGASAEKQHAMLRKDWLRRNRRVFVILAVILVALALIANVLCINLKQPWLAGFASGALLIFWVLIRQSPPGWIENWQLGAWGEQQTAKALKALPAPWVVMHDVTTQRGNIDHLVVGPGGIFLLDSKRWSGTVEVRGEEARVVRWEGGPASTLTGASHVSALARATHDRMIAATRISQWVQPVIVVWADFPQGIAGEKCPYVSGGQLTKWLVERPASIADHRISRIAEAARVAWSAH